MIEIERLTVAFGAVRPLDGLDAVLAAPIVGLIGPNGAGKTTLLNAISGFVTPVAGSVRMNGISLLDLTPVQRVRRGLRRVFQQELVAQDLTAEDNVRAVADHLSSAARARQEVAQAIEMVGLGRRRNVIGRRLTLFERRMVEIARTLVGSPKVILLDEPGAGLNDAETLQLRGLLLEIPRVHDVQVILIDHDADLIASACEETMVLDFGKRLALGPTQKVLQDADVRRAYLGES